MLEETLITIWASINSWFTPTVLFILLNIVIGTIAVTSGFANQKPQRQNRQQEEEDLHHHHHHHHEQQRFHQQLVRAPSNVIQRLKSINLYHFKTEDLNPFSSFSSSHHHDHDHHPHVDHRAEIHQDHHHHQQPSVIQRLKSINLYSFKAEDLNPFHQDHKLDDQAHAHQQQQQQQPPPQSRLARAPSNVIQRLKSINLSDLNPFPSFQQQPPPQLENIIDHHRIQKKTKTPMREISPQNPHDDEFDHHHHHQEVRRSNSDRRAAAKLLVSQKDKVIKKSMSAKLDFWDFGNREEEETEEVVVVRRRPSSTTVKVIKETTKTTKAKAKASESERFGDEEVDAKADDFINRFKHQLKLQRLDSIMRSKDDLLLTKDGKNINL